MDYNGYLFCLLVGVLLGMTFYHWSSHRRAERVKEEELRVFRADLEDALCASEEVLGILRKAHHGDEA